MSIIKSFFPDKGAKKANAVIFLSGSGSNALKILEKYKACEDSPFDVAALVTDAPEKSRARELGSMFDLPVVENDIREFYQKQGEKRVSIFTPRGQQLREMWTNALREQLEEYDVDFGILAGFVPLTNIVGDFPCLNIHPGDLTYVKNNSRYLVGLHTVPIERAILEGLPSLRSSVILVQPYSGKGDEMDSGPLLGISDEVNINLKGHTLEEFRACVDGRPSKRPKGGYGDVLEELACEHQEKLKQGGDWIVFPQCIFDFARGAFGVDQNKKLFYRISKRWQPIKTVVYGQTDKEIIFREPELCQTGSQSEQSESEKD